MRASEKKQRASDITERLKQIYPTPLCALEYGGDEWKLLVMGRLSAQCTDARVNTVSRELFARFPTPRALADAELSEIEDIVRPCGLYRVKARDIKEESRAYVEDFGSRLPSDMGSLLRLQGVGRKIANLLIGDIFKGPAIVTDTHCIRICGRLGLYPESEKNPYKIERILSPLIEPSEQSDFCHRIVMFGREYCTARSPQCDICPIGEAGLCEHKRKMDRRGESHPRQRAPRRQ